MTASGSRRPPAPTCEDCCDEEPQIPSLNSRASPDGPHKRSKPSEADIKPFADKKSHDGSDSGYSSKAGTSDTTSNASKKEIPELKINTKTMDRERQPYHMGPSRPVRVPSSPSKTKDVRIEHPQTPSRFRHEYNMCWVCDQYGYHFDPTKEITRSATAAPPETQKPQRPMLSKPVAKEESDARPTTIRRSSSKRDSRPFNMVVHPNQYPYPPPVGYNHPDIAAHGWQATPTQMSQYPSYHHAYAPHTPLSSSYTQPSFFDQAMQYSSWAAEQQYGTSPYKRYEEHGPHPRYLDLEREPRRIPSRESRQRSSTQRSTKVVEADRIAMPPPPRPEPVRPVIKKAPTETITPISRPTSRRRSSMMEEEDRLALQATMARERRASHSRSTQSRAPSSYRPVPEAPERPPNNRKSQSYSVRSGTVQVASTQNLNRRRTDPVEQRQAEIEAYMAKHGTQSPSLTTGLTTEALKKLDSRRSVTPSDSGSARSSKDSAVGRVRAGTSVTSVPRSTNITMDNGLSLCVPHDYGDAPLDITIGNLRLSMNATKQEEPPKEQKRIEERAPSEISQASRRSLTSGSGASVAKIREDEALTREVTRDAYRPKPSANSSKKSSRAPSRVDHRRKGSRADDYAELDESYYFAYNS